MKFKIRPDGTSRGCSVDPADIEISVGVKGSPGELGPKLRSLGASLFTVGAGGPDYDLSDLRDWIAWRDSQNP